MERQGYVGDNAWATYYLVVAYRNNRGLKTGFSNWVRAYKTKVGETWIKVKVIREWNKSFQVSKAAHKPENSTN